MAATRSSPSRASRSSPSSSTAVGSGSGGGVRRGRPGPRRASGLSGEGTRALEAPEEVRVQDARLGHKLEARFPPLLERVGVARGGGRQRRFRAGADRRHGKRALPEDVTDVHGDGAGGEIGAGGGPR